VNIVTRYRSRIVDGRSDAGLTGAAYYPRTEDSRKVKAGVYEVRVRASASAITRSYPYTYTYKKRAGPVTVTSFTGLLFEVIAHELRHVEQFDACRRAWPRGMPVPMAQPLRHMTFAATFSRFERQYAHGSCEVDAERLAHALLDRWRSTQGEARAAA
jgi:hypothetical protein